MTVSFRSETEADDPFLKRMITETVVEELGAAAWPEPMRTHLAGVQVALRRQGVHGRFPQGKSRIILADGRETGWLYTAAFDDVVWLVEIMVLQECRGKGIGQLAVGSVIDTAGSRPVRLHVNVTNTRAIRLYERAGFRRVGGDEVQHLMEHRGGGA